MKKCIVYVAVLSLLLSLGTVFAAAELPYGMSFTEGAYGGGNPEAYSPVGDITVAWWPNFADEINLTDGDLSDWYATDLTRTNITPDHMISWMQNQPLGDFKITSFAAADSDYLYLAFDIVDDDFAYGTELGYYNGDALQLALDFGGMMKKTIEEDPDVLSSFKNMFYSFSCEGDGAPIHIMRQESDNDKLLTEEGGDGVKGAARKTELGWSVEIALSWQLMYDDYVWKAWAEDARIYIGSDAHLPLTVSACLYCLDRAETGGEILWAAGTVEERKNDAGNPCVSWTAYDNSATFVLPWEEGMHINCDGVVNVYPLGTIVPETETPYEPMVTEIPEIEYPVEPETETVTAVEWEETLRDAAESMDAEDELNAILEKYGCTAVLGGGGLALLTALAAAAYALKKK